MKLLRFSRLRFKEWIFGFSFILMSFYNEGKFLSCLVSPGDTTASLNLFDLFSFTNLENRGRTCSVSLFRSMGVIDAALDVKLKEGIVRGRSPPTNDVWENQNKAKAKENAIQNDGLEDVEGEGLSDVKIGKDEERKDKEKEESLVNVMSNLDGPPLFTSLYNSPCLSTETDNYIYDMCLFRNITQSRDDASSDPILLGTWDAWSKYNTIKEENSIVAEEQTKNQETSGTNEGKGQVFEYWMNYEDGSSCRGGNRRSAHVQLLCSKKEFKIDKVEEPYPCEYHLQLSTPIPCYMFEESLSSIPLTKPRKRDGENKKHNEANQSEMMTSRTNDYMNLSEEEIDSLDENSCKIALKVCQGQTFHE